MDWWDVLIFGAGFCAGVVVVRRQLAESGALLREAREAYARANGKLLKASKIHEECQNIAAQTERATRARHAGGDGVVIPYRPKSGGWDT